MGLDAKLAAVIVEGMEVVRHLLSRPHHALRAAILLLHWRCFGNIHVGHLAIHALSVAEILAGGSLDKVCLVDMSWSPLGVVNRRSGLLVHEGHGRSDLLLVHHVWLSKLRVGNFKFILARFEQIKLLIPPHGVLGFWGFGVFSNILCRS